MEKEPQLDDLLSELAGLDGEEEEEPLGESREEDPSPAREEEPTQEPPKEEAPSEEKNPPVLDLTNPEVQASLGALFREWQSELHRRYQQESSAKELESLIAEGNVEEIGKRFVQEYSKVRDRQRYQKEILTDFLEPVYLSLLSHEAFKNLDRETAMKLHPDRYSDDRTYLLALSDHIAQWSAKNGKAEDREQQEQSTARARQEALQKVQEVAQVTGAPGASSVVPNAGQPDVMRTPARDLLKYALNNYVKSALNEE